MEVVINRFQSEDKQTLGQMTVFSKDGGIAYQCATLELDWQDNERRKSCIPLGEYDVHLHDSPKYGRCYWVKDVPERSEILIHHGNYHRNTLGCILVGRRHIDIDGDGYRDVTSSKATMVDLLNVLPRKFKIRIV